MCCGSVYHLGVFFFFKQKTAYDMRISDWSSDVCSSDLAGADVDDGVGGVEGERLHQAQDVFLIAGPGHALAPDLLHDLEPHRARLRRVVAHGVLRQLPHFQRDLLLRPDGEIVALPPRLAARSEEHTSELQSLMRNSYAVFCLKKKKKQKKKRKTTRKKPYGRKKRERKRRI